MRALIIAASVLLTSATAALADPISSLIVAAVGLTGTAATTAIAVTTFVLSSTPAGRGLFIKGRRQ